MIIPGIFIYLTRLLFLKGIAMSVWAGMGAPRNDSEAISWAIAEAITESPEKAVWGPERTAAAMAYFSAEESDNRLDVVGAWPIPTYGAWQEKGAAGKGSALAQAREWLLLLQLGNSICPESPAAPLTGGCHQAYKMANRRAKTAWRLAGLL